MENLLCIPFSAFQLRSSTSDDGDSEAGESGSSASSSGSFNDKPRVGHVSLTVSRLESMHALHSIAVDDLCQTAQHGMSKKRVLSVLRHNVCSCGCKMPARDLYQICRAFWQLPKTSQDAALWSIQAECSQKRCQWSLEGWVLSFFGMVGMHMFFKAGIAIYTQYDHDAMVPGSNIKVDFPPSGHELCRESWIRYLGVGSDRVSRCKRTHQGVDKRTLSSHGSAPVAV